MADRACRRALIFLLVVFVALASVYNVTNPLFEAPDEVWHYFFAKYVREHGELPVQAESRVGVFSQQEAGQTPLYYVLGAGLTFWTAGAPAEQWLRSNPHGSIGALLTDGNKNRFVHGSGEDFPYSGDYLAAHLLRLLSTLFGAGTVLFTYLCGRQLWPKRPALALGAATLNSFIPQFLFMSAAISNDVPVSFLCSVGLWLALIAVRTSQVGVLALGMGVVGGLATMTKSIAITALPLALLALTFVSWKQRSIKLGIQSALLVTIGWTLLSAWWFLRNLTLYGDLTPLKQFLGRTSLYDQVPTVADIIKDLGGLWASFWALFGWFSILVDDRVYQFFAIIVVAALMGLVILTVGKRRAELWNVEVGLVVIWIVLVIGSLLGYRLIVQAFQGRLLFAGISAFSLMIMLGLSAIVPGKLIPKAIGVGGMLMAGIAIVLPFQYIVPAYAQPGPVEYSKETNVTLLSATLGTEVEMLGYRLSSDSLQPGETVEVLLYWRALSKMERDFSVFLHLVDWNGNVVSQMDSYPGKGNNATSLWVAGQVYSDSYKLRIPAEIAAPAMLRLVTGMYQVDGMARLPVRLADGSVPREVPVGVVRVVDPKVVASQGLHRADVSLGGKVVLEGYELVDKRLLPGGLLAGDLYWKAQDTFDADYTVFVQMLGPAGLVGQDDQQPRGGSFPTSVWNVGDRVPHHFEVTIPATLAEGSYQLITGLYDAKTGKRLTASETDYVDLGSVEVVNTR